MNIRRFKAMLEQSLYSLRSAVGVACFREAIDVIKEREMNHKTNQYKLRAPELHMVYQRAGIRAKKNLQFCT